MKNLIITLSIFGSLSATANTCWENFKRETETQMQEREYQYQILDKKFSQLTDLAKAYTQEGSKDELVILLHGFLANPNEVRSIADTVNRAGYPVYSGLIPGYGATAKVANYYKKEHWIWWSQQEIARAEKCFSKIHLIGFSTGATIFHDYVSTHPEDKKIQSVVLISSFFQNKTIFDWFLKITRASGIKEAGVSWVFSHLPVPDVQVIHNHPETYLQRAPVDSMFEVIDLGKMNQKRQLERKITVPTLGVVSEEDWVASPTKQKRVLRKNFEDLELITYRRPGHIPHQVMLHEVSQVADQVHELVMDFIERHSKADQ